MVIGQTFTMNLPWSYGIGRVVNTINGASKIIAHNAKLDPFPGGRGVVTMTLQKVSDGLRLTESELNELARK